MNHPNKLIQFNSKFISIKAKAGTGYFDLVISVVKTIYIDDQSINFSTLFFEKKCQILESYSPKF